MIAAATVEAYRKRMRSLAKLSPIEIWYSKIDLVGEIEHIGHRALRRELKGILKKARGHLEEDDNFPIWSRASRRVSRTGRRSSII